MAGVLGAGNCTDLVVVRETGLDAARGLTELGDDKGLFKGPRARRREAARRDAAQQEALVRAGRVLEGVHDGVVHQEGGRGVVE